MIQLKGSDVTLYLKNLGGEINEAVTSSMDTENIDLIVGSLFILFIIAGIVVTTIVSIMMRKGNLVLRWWEKVSLGCSFKLY